MERKSVKFGEFDVKSDNWDNYIDRLRYCFEANGIVLDSAQRANFFTICGARVFEILLALITPRKSNEVSFSEIVTILTKHFSPKPNEISSSYKFYKRDQKQDETASEFIAQLRKLCSRCNFLDMERMLRDRIVCGMTDRKLQFELLKKDNLRYEDAVDALLSTESAGRDALMMHNAGAGYQPATSAALTLPTPPEQMDINAVQSRSNDRMCYRCGGRHGGECRFINAICRFCQKKGHIEKICTAKKKNRGVKINYTDDDETTVQLNGIYNIGGSGARVPAFVVTLLLNGVPVTMEVDSGAAFSLVNLATWALMRPSADDGALSELPNRLCTWNNSQVAVIGQAKVQVQYKDIKCDLNVIVARGSGPNLLGRNWFEALGIVLNVNMICVLDLSPVDRVIAKHSEVFREGLGTYRGEPVTIYLKPNSTPKFLKARSVAYASKDKVENEIDRLMGEGVLRPVSFSEWATPVVSIPKSNGDIRLCGDYRSTVNQATESDTYPMPTASEVFATVAGGKFYTKLDLERAYTQVPVSDTTARLLTLNTCKGLFTVHRLAFGVKACPGIFQRLMTSLLAGVLGVAVLIDDIIISGRTMMEMTERLDIVLERIEKAGLRLNKDKCKFAKERVEFLGFVIDAEGIHPAPSKVESIFNTPEPKNVKQLQAFLGLYNFYERFVPNKASLLEPLHRLLDKSQCWKWTDREQSSFDAAKSLLSSDLTLVHYDLNKPLVLTCDSSEYGVGAVLSHIMEDGQERPVAMGSRTLHTHERRYSQLDKEATAISFGLAKFHNYLSGRSFTIVTDHKPLLGIFDPKRPIPAVLSPRLIRIAIILTSHDYNIVYKPGKQIGHADGLSRWPQPVPDQPKQQLCDVLLMAETPSDFPVDADQIALATKRDKILSRVSHYVLSGWPAKMSDDELRPYWLNRTELSIHEDCVLLGCRVVVPPSIRKTVLSALHKTHSGIVQTKALARSYVWWPKLNEDIEVLVGNCNKCLEHRHMPPKTKGEWITPTKPWSRVNVDFAGPFQGKSFLIVVDAYSRWPEVIIVNNMTSATVIRHLRNIFAIHGLCETLVSDNGTPFVSGEMRQFLDANKIKQVTIAPYHPATNGLAERMVQTVKDKLRKMEDLSWDVKIPNMLLGLRTTPCTVTNKAPSELLMNRRLRTLLDTIHPDNRVRQKRDQQITSNAQKTQRETNVGQNVMYRNYSNVGPRWLPGTVVNRNGPSSYGVSNVQGNVVHRHIDQLIKTKNNEAIDPIQAEGDRLEVAAMEGGSSVSVDQGVCEPEVMDHEILEVPSADKWAEVLGIPLEYDAGYSGGKLKNKLTTSHNKRPYDKPLELLYIA